jgi:hypothetical protein
MFVESFKLSKSSWHAKMMKFMWNLNPTDFSHICPYFWLSVFNVLTIIPYLILRLTFGLLGVILKDTFQWVETYFERKEREAYQKRMDRLVNNPKEQEKLITNSCYKTSYRLLNDLRYQNYDLWKQVYDARTDYQLKRENAESEKKQQQYKQSIARKKRINDALKYVKPIAAVFLWVIIGILTTAVIYGIYWCIAALLNISVATWLFTGKLITWAVVIVIALIILFKLFKWLIESCSEVCITIPKWILAIGRGNYVQREIQRKGKSCL